MNKSLYQKVVTKGSLKPALVNFDYSVKGPVMQKAVLINQNLKKNIGNYPFKQTIPLNTGDPGVGGQKTLSFVRNVMGCMLQPELLKSEMINQDVRNRVETYLARIGYLGATSGNPAGFDYAREKIAEFIDKRDGVKGSNPDNIFITHGASEGAQLGYKLCLQNPDDGIYLPRPTYPLYSAQVTYNDAQAAYYDLNEGDKWTFSVESFAKNIRLAKDSGKKLKCALVINPGNPGGYLLKENQIEQIIRICYEENLFLIADEALQGNIIAKGAEFVSFRKVIMKMGEPFVSNLEMISLHSSSKGYIGECGIRGGYLETMNLDPFANHTIWRIKSQDSCANVAGQIATLLMVDEPTRGIESDKTVDFYEEEAKQTVDALNFRAKLLVDRLNGMEGLTCADFEGGANAFPSINIPQKAIDEAKKKGMHPDHFYCDSLLDTTGIVTLPGYGFNEKEGEFHFRVTNLIHPTERMQSTLDLLEKFAHDFQSKYA